MARELKQINDFLKPYCSKISKTANSFVVYYSALADQIFLEFLGPKKIAFIK